MGFATVAAILGHVLAGYGPMRFGGGNSVSAAAMIVTASGLILVLTALFGPGRGGIRTVRSDRRVKCNGAEHRLANLFWTA